MSDGPPTASMPLPPGWQVVRLGEVCRLVSGSTPDSNNSEYWNGDIVWITPTDLGRLTGPEIKNASRRISKLGYESCGTEIVPTGSVVLSSRAPIGHVGIASVPLCTNQGCKSFVPSNQIDSWFLYFALKRYVPELQILGSGATFTEVSKAVLKDFRISIPSLAEQRRIAAKLREQMEAVECARNAAEEQLETINHLPAALLRDAFAGRL